MSTSMNSIRIFKIWTRAKIKISECYKFFNLDSYFLVNYFINIIDTLCYVNQAYYTFNTICILLKVDNLRKVNSRSIY